MALRAGAARRLGSLLLFALLVASAAPLSWELPEPRSRASKIRVHPRGNLWATGKSSDPESDPHHPLNPIFFSSGRSATDISVPVGGDRGTHLIE